MKQTKQDEMVKRMFDAMFLCKHDISLMVNCKLVQEKGNLTVEPIHKNNQFGMFQNILFLGGNMEYIKELEKYKPVSTNTYTADHKELYLKIQELTEAINQIIRDIAILT